MIDYKLLLWKYIQHIGEIEGFTYIQGDITNIFYDRFTEEEQKELVSLDDSQL